MDCKIAHEKLVEIIRSESIAAREGMQVSRRSLELLPKLLRLVIVEEFPSLKGAKAERHALTSKDYLNHIDNHVQTVGDSMRARVNFETHRMLYQARQSIRSANQAKR